jgi:AcrR family transcriptional regulator
MTKTTRQEVLGAAARLLLRHGVPDLTVQEVANELGISKGSAYYHMGSKEEMIFAMIMAGSTKVIREIEEIMRHPLSPADRLRLCLRAAARAACEDDLPRVALQLPSAVNFLTAERRRAYTANTRIYQGLFEDLIKEGISRGEWRSDCDVKLTVFAIIGMTQNLGQWYRADGRLRLEDIADTWWELLLRGLRRDLSTAQTRRGRNSDQSRRLVKSGV